MDDNLALLEGSGHKEATTVATALGTSCYTAAISEVALEAFFNSGNSGYFSSCISLAEHFALTPHDAFVGYKAINSDGV
jgi:hypothetical protein